MSFTTRLLFFLLLVCARMATPSMANDGWILCDTEGEEGKEFLKSLSLVGIALFQNNINNEKIKNVFKYRHLGPLHYEEALRAWYVFLNDGYPGNIRYRIEAICYFIIADQIHRVTFEAIFTLAFDAPFDPEHVNKATMDVRLYELPPARPPSRGGDLKH
ncbi:hypothetical protein AXF42_Ash004090 [Apostasia shenzhenica]|uniref:Uncharacterized protein n=1 Tax=Apostasia shenzhenica TaxID=1088818 RepID=A0A2I0A1X6_9ASPA|nr:hypothetical protein AXF42_Ash004090 [Apostasia shenzhenica]